MKHFLSRILSGGELHHSQFSQLADHDPEQLHLDLESMGAADQLLGWSSSDYPEEEGSPGLNAVIEISLHPDWLEHIELVARDISTLPSVDQCFRWMGDREVLVFAKCQSVHEMALIVRDELMEISGIGHSFTHFLLRRFEDQGYQHIQG